MTERKVFIGGINGNSGRRYVYDDGRRQIGLDSMPGDQAFYALVDNPAADRIAARTAFKLLSRFLGLMQGPADCRTIDVPQPITTQTSTPWGRSQDAYEYAPGIICYSTSSHGGFWLNPERMAEFRQQFPGFQPFAGGEWFEEDCDCTLVMLAFAECFDDYAVWSALECYCNDDYFTDEGWLESEQGRHVQERAEDYFQRSKHLWLRGSCGTSGHGWHVSLRRMDGSEQCMVAMPDYPAKVTYSDEELEAFTRLAPAGWDKIEGDPPGRTTLPFFATNGAIVLEQEDRDRWIVSVALRLGNSVRVVVDTDTTMVDGDWLVENPPTWLHTEEDLIDVRRMARDGVRALLETRFQAAKASMAPAFSEAECSSDADPGL